MHSATGVVVVQVVATHNAECFIHVLATEDVAVWARAGLVVEIICHRLWLQLETGLTHKRQRWKKYDENLHPITGLFRKGTPPRRNSLAVVTGVVGFENICLNF